MSRFQWEINPVALLAFALLYFFDNSGLYAALIPAVAAHEAGHIVTLYFAGYKPRRLRLGLCGLEMDYEGKLSGAAGAAAIAAGPFAGLVYGLLAFVPMEFLRLSGEVSIVLSLFNLLPVLPLDGGRLLDMALGEWGSRISRGISILLAFGGLWLWLSRGWFSLFAMGIWLAWYNFVDLCMAQRPQRAEKRE